MLQTPTKWKDYELLDSGDSMKLERWGQYVIARPEPQSLWPKQHDQNFWDRAQAVYARGAAGKGAWQMREKLPDRWQIAYQGMKFWVRPTDFKHTGLFPEQAVNWGWMQTKTNDMDGRGGLPLRPKMLNLFAYTGAATLVGLAAGYEVTHVDASEGIVAWAKENALLNSLHERSVRWIVDDVTKFVAREERRGQKYDVIVMDPPSYGRGKKNELWKIEEMLWPLMQKCKEVLSDTPLFFTINSYTAGMSATVLENMVRALHLPEGKISSGEIGLRPKGEGYPLPAGIFARWERQQQGSHSSMDKAQPSEG